MSRLGKMPVAVPKGVTATIEGQTVKAKGAKGELAFIVPTDVEVKQEGATLVVAPRAETKQARTNWGLSRAMLKNIVTGVSDGFSKRLEINGVGYKAAVQGKTLNLALGYSHDINYPIPDGIKVETPKPTEIIISGIDRQKVGQVAAEIREFRGPEPYKGKGVKYGDEKIFRKEGKKK
jgi:large subunit ribosomal protein L6